MEELKANILRQVRAYMRMQVQPLWRAGHDRVPYSGRVIDEEELVALTDASLDCWLTLGPWGDRLEAGLSDFLGVRHIALVNSGSSANLVAITALLSPTYGRRLRPGDEVITPAATFPTTLAPIVQNGLVPVFVDCELGTYNAAVNRIEEALSPKTRALVLPHTLGNVFDLDQVSAIRKRHDLALIEDCCDALGSKWRGQSVGSFGDFATLSFYPAHHMTMGEGGAVFTTNAIHGRTARSIRDWGRDCWCPTGVSNTCGKRFGWQLGELPEGYDHKYIYSHIGYNLKPTDLQAAVGVAQLRKLPDFIARRKRNFARLFEGLKDLDDFILPSWDARADVSWFAFPLTVKPGAPFTRKEVIRHLEDAKIETRMLFAGNLLRQPGYIGIPHRVAGELRNTDLVMENMFFLGVFPGLTDPMVDYMIEQLQAFVRKARQ